MGNSLLHKPIPVLSAKLRFTYDETTGSITGVMGKRYKRTCSERGDIQIKWGNDYYLAARIAWAVYYGTDPGQYTIDHIDGDATNNRISNLQLVPMGKQHLNTWAAGFSFNNHRGMWGARIRDGSGAKNSRTIGWFDCPLLARLAYEEEYEKIHGIPPCSRVPKGFDVRSKVVSTRRFSRRCLSFKSNVS